MPTFETRRHRQVRRNQRGAELAAIEVDGTKTMHEKYKMEQAILDAYRFTTETGNRIRAAEATYPKPSTPEVPDAVE